MSSQPALLFENKASAVGSDGASGPYSSLRLQTYIERFMLTYWSVEGRDGSAVHGREEDKANHFFANESSRLVIFDSL
jgi:hypothetical protein